MKCVEAAQGHQQTLRSFETPNCRVSRGVPEVCRSWPRTLANVGVILNLEVAAAGPIDGKSLFLFFRRMFWLNDVKCEAFVKFCEANRILRSKCNLVCTWYQVCVRELRRSDEVHQQIKCLEAQSHQQTPRNVHALLRSFWIFRYQLLPQMKAASVCVLQTLVLCQIWSFRRFF